MGIASTEMTRKIRLKAGDNHGENVSLTFREADFEPQGYPRGTDDKVLSTIRLATSLPLDYLSFTLPYPML